MAARVAAWPRAAAAESAVHLLAAAAYRHQAKRQDRAHDLGAVRCLGRKHRAEESTYWGLPCHLGRNAAEGLALSAACAQVRQATAAGIR